MTEASIVVIARNDQSAALQLDSHAWAWQKRPNTRSHINRV